MNIYIPIDKLNKRKEVFIYTLPVKLKISWSVRILVVVEVFLDWTV